MVARVRAKVSRAKGRGLVDWLAPAVLIPATIVVLILCVRAAVRALKAERAQQEDQEPTREPGLDGSDGAPGDDRRQNENR